MRITLEIDAHPEWVEKMNGGITGSVTEQGFNSLCDSLADVGDVGDVTTEEGGD